MGNPFDDQDGRYIVLVNDERQYSLWPAAMQVPAGWAAVHGPAGRSSCLDYVNEHWIDMRPQSLVALMDTAPA
jgi:MbtH protein